LFDDECVWIEIGRLRLDCGHDRGLDRGHDHGLDHGFKLVVVTRPRTTDLEVGIERAFEVIVLACFFGPFHHDGANLDGDLGATTSDQFVMNPAYENNFTIPSILETAI